MHQVLKKNLFLVKEHVGIFKAANNFDIHDPDTGEVVMECREDDLGIFTKILRFTDFKRMTPFDVKIRTPVGDRIVRITRGISIFLSDVKVWDENNNLIGGFKQQLFSIGGAFSVVDANEKIICQLKGKWTGWDFKFLDGDKELAHVSKQWNGLGKELFTSADNYVLEIAENVAETDNARALILAAVMCIDMVLKE
jgi:uncharacterized protein YxjI